MTRQTGSVNRLKGIVTPLAAFATLHPPGGSSRHTTGETLPAPLRLAALRGEGVLRQRFFNQLAKQFPHEPSPEQWLDYWQRFVVDRGAIADLVRRAHLHQASGLTEAPDEGDDETCFLLYCAMLDALFSQGKEQLLLVAVEKFFIHLWRQQFPDGPRDVSSKKEEARVLHERLRVALRKQFHKPVEIKESFRQMPDKVEFRLLYLIQGEPPVKLVNLERPRLKPARLAAYEAALEQIANHCPTGLVGTIMIST